MTTTVSQGVPRAFPNGVSLSGKFLGGTESASDHLIGRGHHNYGRNRGQSNSHGKHGREPSPSTCSSSSSESLDSNPSFGSLPDCDDVSKQQLFLVKQLLIERLLHPEQPIDQDILLDMRKDFNAAKSVPSSPQISRQEFERMQNGVKVS